MTCVVAVPPDPRRLRARGFDLAARLAAAVSEHYRLPLAHTMVWRQAGPPQRSLGGAERRRLPKDRFRAAPCHGAGVLVIDDVMTTGSTLAATAVALRAAGAVKVQGLTLARVGDPSSTSAAL